MKVYRDAKILSNVEVSPNIYKIVLEGGFQGKPGQFYMVRGWNGLDPFLSRPISIGDINDGNITFLYEVRGKGTHIISKLGEGQSLSILGPLGNGFDLKPESKVALISGGVGIAPMYYLSKNLSKKTDLYAGFRNTVYFAEEFESHINNVFLATEDGSFGYQGYIVDIFEPDKYDFVYACGPMAMMEAVINKCRDKVPVCLSMESHMACGIGTCLGCTISTSRGMERVCKEGPVFRGEEVFLNE